MGLPSPPDADHEGEPFRAHMGHVEAHDPQVLQSYEGLIFRTTQRIASYLEDDFDDIAQVFRIKVFQALMAFDPARSALPRDRYVFTCLKNQEKDLLKKRRRYDRMIEDIDHQNYAQDRFYMRYLSESHDDVFGDVDQGDVLIPNTLTTLELKVLLLLYRDYRQAEIAKRLEVEKRVVERMLRDIRVKMADWRPDSGGGAQGVAEAPLAVPGSIDDVTLH